MANGRTGITGSLRIKLAETESLKQRILQSKKQIEGYEAKKVASQKILENTQDRLRANRKLKTSGYVSKETILDQENKETNLQSEIAVINMEIIRSEQEIKRIEIELSNLQSKYLNDALNELKDVQMKLVGLKEECSALKDSLEKVIIKSTIDGIVNDLNYYTIGSSVPANYTILEISPRDDKLVIEAKIPPENIDSINVGLHSKVRFSAFKSRTTPSFTGKLVSLSPDIIVESGQQTMDPKLAKGYYVARIELDMEEFNLLAKPRHLRLQPGMQAEVQIIIGTRTLMQYLLAPISDAIFDGFKEK